MADLVSTKRTGAGSDDRVFTDDNKLVVPAVAIIGKDGNQKVDLSDYGKYKIDADASPNYYGFERRDGAWYIMKETISAGDDTYEYTKGSSDIATNWTNRVSLSYDTFANTF